MNKYWIAGLVLLGLFGWWLYEYRDPTKGNWMSYAVRMFVVVPVISILVLLGLVLFLAVSQ